MALVVAALPIDFDDAGFNWFLRGLLSGVPPCRAVTAVTQGASLDQYEIVFMKNDSSCAIAWFWSQFQFLNYERQVGAYRVPNYLQADISSSSYAVAASSHTTLDLSVCLVEHSGDSTIEC